MHHRVSQNWLVGLTRHPTLLQRFPFLQALAHRYRVSVGSNDCNGPCGQKASMKQFTNQVNEVAKILATIPEDDIDEFKEMVKITSLQVSYVDTRGQTQTVIR